MRTIARRAATVVAISMMLLPSIGSAPTEAQTYPDRPVKVVLPFGPGGIADVTMRLVAGKLSERLGQQFVIENKPGPGGINAAMTVKTAAADGYAMLLNGNGSAISASLFKQLPYDIEKDFTPVSVLAQFDMILATKSGGEIDSIKKLLEAAKANPGKLNFGTVAAGSTQNLSAEIFKAMTGVDVAVVPFRTSPDLVTALMRGDVHVAFEFLAALAPALSDKSIRMIGSGGEKRSPLTPDVPTVIESGVPDYFVTSWNGVSVPVGTPQPVVAKLNQEINAVLAQADVKQRFTQLGMEVAGSTPEGMVQRMRADIPRWRGIIQKLGLQK